MVIFGEGCLFSRLQIHFPEIMEVYQTVSVVPNTTVVMVSKCVAFFVLLKVFVCYVQRKGWWIKLGLMLFFGIYNLGMEERGDDNAREISENKEWSNRTILQWRKENSGKIKERMGWQN